MHYAMQTGETHKDMIQRETELAWEGLATFQHPDVIYDVWNSCDDHNIDYIKLFQSAIHTYSAYNKIAYNNDNNGSLERAVVYQEGVNEAILNKGLMLHYSILWQNISDESTGAYCNSEMNGLNTQSECKLELWATTLYW